MSEFSTTRAADYVTAKANNAQLAPAIAWLLQHSACSRLSEIEVYETLQLALNGPFTISYNSTAITAAQVGS